MELSLLLPKNLNDLASLSQVLQLIIVVIGFVYGKKQLDELVRTRNLEATRELIKELGSQEIREIRTWLLHEFNETPSLDSLVELEKEDLEKVRKIAVAYDRIGFLVSQGVVPEKQLYAFQKDEIKLLWRTCKPILIYIRTHGGRPGYCTHFEHLGETWLKKMEWKELPFIERVIGVAK